jgi:hypothetical protein
VTTIKKIVDGDIWYIAEEDTEKERKKFVFNTPIKFSFDKTEFNFRTVWNPFDEYEEMSAEDVPVNSVIEYENKIYLVITHCDKITGLRTCYQLSHTKRKEVIYSPYSIIKIAAYEQITLLTTTFERFCNLYELYGKI